MGYIQDRLVESLGGEKVINSSNTVIGDWTPNNIKTLIVCKYYIIVMYHIGEPKIVKLDSNIVNSDMASMSGTPCLNVILRRRSFSCLEELYFDVDFVKNPGIVDIVGYAKELVKGTSRLRCIGYGVFYEGSERLFLESYKANKNDLDYLIAKDYRCPVKFEYREVGNKNWYKNYYLRPQYYKLDGDTGRLSNHFKNFENSYKDFLAEKENIKKKKILDDYIDKAIANDVSNIPAFRKFDNLLSVLSMGNNDSVKKIVLDVCRNHLGRGNVFPGLSKELITGHLEMVSDSKYLYDCYKHFGVLDDSNTSLSVDKVFSRIEKNKGFIDILDVLDSICTLSAKALIGSGYKDVVAMALLVREGDIPDGKLRSTYIKKQGNSTRINGFFGFLEEIIGVVL